MEWKTKRRLMPCKSKIAGVGRIHMLRLMLLKVN